MSSNEEEGSVCPAGLNPEGGQPAGRRQARRRRSRALPKGPQGPQLDRDLGPPQSRKAFGSASPSEGMKAKGRVLWIREGRPAFPAGVQGPALDYLADEASVAVLQQLTDRGALGVRRNPSSESSTAEAATVWANPGPVLREGGVRVHRWVGSQRLASTFAARLHHSVPEGGQAWGGLKRGARGRSAAGGTGELPWRSPESLVWPTSDSESSDERNMAQLLRVTISRKGLATPRSSEGPGDAPRQPSTHAKEVSFYVPGPILSSSPRGLTSAVGEQEASSSKKTPSVVCGKVESNRPGFLVAAPAAARGRIGATLCKKAPQEKAALREGSSLVFGRSFSSLGQRLPAPPLVERVTFPTTSAAPRLDRSKKSSSAPLGVKQCKLPSAGKKPVAKPATESAEEDNGGKGDQVPKGQPPAHKPGPPSLCVYRGGFSSGDFNTRSPRVPIRSQHLALSRGNVLPRGGLTASGDQELLQRPPRLERQQQQQQQQQQPPPPPPPPTEGCPRCPVLQREVHELKEQLEAMQSLTNKLYSL